MRAARRPSSRSKKYSTRATIPASKWYSVVPFGPSIFPVRAPNPPAVAADHDDTITEVEKYLSIFGR